MDTLSVTLIVKAPNQQFEDQTIKCETTWSIRKLKGYLSEVYPCNPTLDEQKLIYSGQLLNDSHILKDVLRQYEGQDTHTVHLVYTPKNRPFAPSTTKLPRRDNGDKTGHQQTQSQQQTQQPAATQSSDGLRNRRTGTSEQSSTGQMPSQLPPPPPTFMTGFLNTSQPFMPAMSFVQSNANQSPSQYTPEQYALAQQMAVQNMMHQMYLQYMNQYAVSMQRSNSVSNVPNFSANYFPQGNFGMPQFAANGANSATANTEQQLPPQPPQQEAPQMVQPQRFQAGGDDDAENRDWLEILYTLSRLLVLLSLVYFYSSPGRCMIVILAFVLYYFYQNHQRNLRDRQQTERLQEAVVEPDVIDAPVENAEPQNVNDANNENEQSNSSPLVVSADNENPTVLTSGEQDENNRLPAITLLRTFILSFFSSLIPETPAV